MQEHRHTRSKLKPTTHQEKRKMNWGDRGGPQNNHQWLTPTVHYIRFVGHVQCLSQFGYYVLIIRHICTRHGHHSWWRPLHGARGRQSTNNSTRILLIPSLPTLNPFETVHPLDVADFVGRKTHSNVVLLKDMTSLSLDTCTPILTSRPSSRRRSNFTTVIPGVSWILE